MRFPCYSCLFVMRHITSMNHPVPDQQDIAEPLSYGV